MTRIIRLLYCNISLLLCDPLKIVKRLAGIPFFLRNLLLWVRRNKDGAFSLKPAEFLLTSGDRFESAGLAQGHYFWQDLWAAKHLYRNNVTEHLDIGSRIDGFIAHILPFCKVRYMDFRSLGSVIDDLTFLRGSILSIPLPARSVKSLSCLHVIEHIGLGRYGDIVEPQAYRAAAQELSRVLAPGGELLFSTPVGRERLCFDAHRVFDPATVIDIFGPLHLREFHLIDDTGTSIRFNASFEDARVCEYGCGLFVFERADSG